MTGRSAALYGFIALGSLLFAVFGRWQSQPPPGASEALLADVRRSELRSVRLAGGGAFWELYQPQRSGGEIWLRYASPDVAELDRRGERREVVAFREVRASLNAELLFESFAPLRAARSLGKRSPEQLHRAGVEGKSLRLVIKEWTGREHAFEVLIASESNGAYVLRPDGRTYLLARSLPLPDIMNHLADERLSRAGGGTSRLTLRAGGASRAFRLDLSSGSFVSLDGLQREERLVDWHRRMRELEAVHVLGRGEEPAGRPPEICLRIEEDGGHRVEYGEAHGRLFGRSDFSPGWVELDSSGLELLRWAVELVKAVLSF